jgi:hypothetical protein
MATSSVNLAFTLTFTADTQTAANQERAATIRDFALDRGLDIWQRDAQGNPTSQIDPARVQPAIEDALHDWIVDRARVYRESNAASAAVTAQRQQDDARLPARKR